MADPWSQFQDADPWSQFQDAPATKPAPKKKSLGEDVASAFGGAVENVKKVYRENSKPAPTKPGVGGFVQSVVDDQKRTGNLLGALVSVPLAPVGAAFDHVVTDPAASLLDKLPGPTYERPRAPWDPNFGKPLRQLTPEETHQQNKGIVTEALSAMGPGKGGPKVAPRPTPKPNVLAQDVARFEEAGVTPNLAAVKGGGAAKAANAIAENPLAGIRSRAQLRGQANELASSAERTAGRYGAPASRGATGEAVQQGIGDFNKRFSERASKIYDQAFADIESAQEAAVQRSGAQAQAANDARSGDLWFTQAEAKPAPVVRPTSTQQALRDITGRVNSRPLSEVISDPKIARIASALEAGQADLRFGDLRALRTWVREAQKDQALRQGVSQSQLQQLEAGLTQDIYANAEALGGPKALRKLQQADQFYRLGSQRIEGQLQAFVGKGQPKAGESTYDLILRAAGDKGGADSQRLLALKKSLRPDEWGDVAATTIDRMGQPTAGAALPGEQGFSVSRFVTNYESLSPQGKSMLFGTGALRRELDNLAYVAGKLKAVEKGANHSNSATSLQTIGTVGGLINPATTLPTAKVLAGLALGGEAVTNPAVVRWMARMAAAERQNPAQVTIVVRQLGQAARANTALLPLYQQSVKLLETPKLATPTAATEQQQPRQ